MFARALQENPDAELVAICDRSPAVLAAMVDQLGVPGHASTEDLLSAHPELDAVVIATPTSRIARPPCSVPAPDSTS
ncbi:Gfo/Idh/MocA family oxidoreductase [Microbacterium sp. Se5.02b]|nr:Gfo/Idh/MocA family oxidoreductase [Microbacterium sp. Se5.02b]